MAPGVDVSWPPSAAQGRILDALARLIERAGAAHLLDAPVVRADAVDLPAPWDRTARSLAALLERLAWLAYVDLDVELVDLRRGIDGTAMLTRTVVDWVGTHDGVARFQVEALGNDDVAGHAAHELGRAFAAWLAGDAPYRDVAAEAPSARDGSIAAYYLGLGVLAANVARYNRVAGTMVGSTAITETEVAQVGGLTLEDGVFLLAVQAVLRDQPVAAHATLREHVREPLRAQIATLRPHRAALAARLGLELDAPRRPLERDDAPPTPRDHPEPIRQRRFAGHRTYRLQRTRAGMYGLAGLGLGFVGLVVALDVLELGSRYRTPTVVFSALLAPLVIGAVRGWTIRTDYCTSCGVPMPAAATDCPGCGAWIAGRVTAETQVAARELEADDAPAAPAAAAPPDDPDDPDATGAATGR